MQKKIEETGRQVFSEALRNAIMADRLYVEVDLPKLEKEDVENLKAILSGKKATTFEVDMKRAINALARSDRSAAGAELLVSILSDEEQPAKVRALAALNLSAYPLAKAEDVLIGQLNNKSPMVQAAAIKALGRAGSSKALDALKRVEPDNERTKKQLSFAKAAIGFRTKSTSENSADDLSRLLGIGWNDFSATTIKGAEVRINIGQIWGSTYGIELNPEIALEFNCGSLKHCVFFNKAFEQGSFTKAIKAEKMIAGVVALCEEPSHLTIRYVLLSVPTKDGATLSVARNDGDILYSGETTLDRGGLNFKIRDVGLTGTPFEINGLLSDDDIQVGFRVWNNKQVQKKHPEAILP